MVLSSDLLFFLKENALWIVKPPINGTPTAIHSLFNSKHPNQLTFEQFLEQMEILKEIDSCAIEYDTFDTENVLFINEINMSLLLDKFAKKKMDKKQRSKKVKRQEIHTPNDMLTQLQSILQDNEPPKLKHLRSLLSYQSTGNRLTLERMSKTTPKLPFLQTCNDNNHSQFLAFNSVPSRFPKDLFHCIQHKIHFIPIIKQHTDTSLGDCSYLDTCHKLDSCRYLHYKKHIPYSALEKSIQDCHQFNLEIPHHEMLAPWCRNGSTSNLSREILPPQWINCDVRSFDFNIVGKFAAVIADPAWNIHMNLPYGTCNDTELLNLPLHTVQDEGILMLWVTGRAIEIGKTSLTKWGYTIMNEMVWIKTNQLGRTICTGRTGHWLNHSKEHLLVGVKGSPQWLDKLVDLDFLVSATRETSRKPDELYGMVERLVGPHARKLEIFGRDHNTLPGWFSEYTSNPFHM